MPVLELDRLQGPIIKLSVAKVAAVHVGVGGRPLSGVTRHTPEPISCEELPGRLRLGHSGSGKAKLNNGRDSKVPHVIHDSSTF